MTQETQGAIKILRQEIRLERDRLHRRRFRRRVTALSIMIGVLLLALLSFRFLWGIDVVAGSSMYPSLQDGDVIFYSRIAQEFHYGDIVVFSQGGTDVVKRVAALPGDTVESDPQSGQVVVNGQVVQEPYVMSTAGAGSFITPLTVLDGHLYVLGDNRDVSIDSRSDEIGSVPVSSLRGRVVWVLRNILA